MIDKVNTHMVGTDNIPTIRNLLRKLARISFTTEDTNKLDNAPEWLPDNTPYTAKKARRFCQSPTDQDMPSPTNELPLSDK